MVFPAGSDAKELAYNVGDPVWSLGQEDRLEKEMVTHSSIPAWEIPWTEEPGGLQSMGLHRIGHNWVTNTFMVECRTFAFILYKGYFSNSVLAENAWWRDRSYTVKCLGQVKTSPSLH